MPRGYRGVILACGLISLGASPPKEDGQQPTQTPKDQIAPSLADIASSHQEIAKPSDLDQPCEEGENKRSSDLCAQWKAADAAKSASNATWLFGALGSLIGGLTLAAAWSAARWARKAAEHTAESVTEAKRSADAAEEALATALDSYEMQMRPYVAITTEEDEAPLPFSRETFLKFVVKNFGQIPATSVRLTIGEAIAPEPFGDFVVPLGDKTGDYGLIAPGDSRTEKIHAKDLTALEIGKIAEGQVKLLVRLRIDYSWSGGSDHHDFTMFLDNPAANEWYLLTERRRHQNP